MPNTTKDIGIIVMGGSSGSIPVLTQIISALPDGMGVPVVIIIHRMRNVDSELKNMLSATKKIREPEDKEPIKKGGIYLAPQNYHLLVEDNKVFSMDYSETVNYSRPSIDVTFISVSRVYKEKTLGVLVSGANMDGAAGLNEIILNGGVGIVQTATAKSPAMPESAIRMNKEVKILTPDNIIRTILNLLS